MSEYVCVVSNGIPTDETWTVKLLVTFPPMMQPKATSVRVPLGGLARLVCTAESWPRPDVTWDKDGQQIFDSDNYATTVSGQYHNVHVLEIRRVTKDHYGNYRCIARNDNGIHFADIDVAGSGLVNSDDEDSDKDIVDGDDDDAAEEEEQSDTQPIRSISYPSQVTQVLTTSSSAEELRQNESNFAYQRLSIATLCLIGILRLYIS